MIFYIIAALVSMIIMGYVLHQQDDRISADEYAWIVFAGMFWPFVLLFAMPTAGVFLSKWKNERERKAKRIQDMGV